MPDHNVLTFPDMLTAGEAIAAQVTEGMTGGELAHLRYTLLLIFEEVSRNMPQEKVYDGVWQSSFNYDQDTFPVEIDGDIIPLGPIVPGSVAVTGSLDIDDFDLFHGTFKGDKPVGDFTVQGTHIANAIVLPLEEQLILLNVHKIEVYRGVNLLSGDAAHTRIDEWDNLLFLYTGGQGGPAFIFVEGDRYRILYEAEWQPRLSNASVPDEWPDGFPDRVKENVLQGYIAHILLQQAAAAQAKALQALIENEDSFTEEILVNGVLVPAPSSLNGALDSLNELLEMDADPATLIDPAVFGSADFVLADFVLAASSPAIPAYVPETNPFTLDAGGNLDSPEAPDFAINPLYAITAEPAGLTAFPVVADPPDLTAIYASLALARNAIIDLADLADLPDNTALEAYIQTGNNSVWSRLTAIRTELEGDTDLDPRNPDRIDKSAWERLDQALQDALSSLRSGYTNSFGVETGLIQTGSALINTPGITTSPKGYLTAGDNFINNVNIGREVPELYSQYSRASLDIGRATVEAAAAQNQQAIGLTNLASAYAQKIEQYLSYARVVLSEWENLSNYLQTRASAVVQNNQAIVAQGQGQAQVSLAKINAIVEEVRARTAIAELDVRIGQLALEDRRSAREVHGRVQETKGFLQTQTWQVQSQAYGNLLQAFAGAYRSRIEVDSSARSTGIQAESANYSTELGGEVQLQTSKVSANIQGYTAKIQSDVQGYTTKTQSITQGYTTKTQSTTQIFIAKLQAAGQKLENIVEAMLRRNEISNQYREIADRYQQEGLARHEIYVRNLREKADAIRRRSSG